MRYLWDIPNEKVQQRVGWMGLKPRREVRATEVGVGVVSIQMVHPWEWVKLPKKESGQH